MKKIMIVDDEILVRIGIKSMIMWERYGYSIIGDASDGEEAWEKIRENRPDIVLTDLMMTPGDGFELIERCSKAYPEIRFIVLSNYNDFDNVRRAMKLGAADYVFKLTVKAEELLKSIEEVSAGIHLAEGEETSGEITRENMEVIKNDLVNKVLNEDLAFGDEMEESLRQLKLSVNFDLPFFLISIRIDNFKIVRKRGEFLETDLLTFTMSNIMEEIFRKEYETENFYDPDRGFLIVVKGLIDETVLGSIKSQFQTLAQAVRQYYGLEISGAVSETGQGIAWLKEADVQNRMILEQNFYGVTGMLKQKEAVLWSELMLPEQYRSSQMERFLERLDFDQVKNHVSGFFKYIEESKCYRPQDVRRKLKHVHHVFDIFMDKSGIRADCIRDARGANMSEAIENYDFLVDIRKSVMELVDQYDRTIREKMQEGSKYRQAVLQIKKHVEENLAGDLSVAAAASMMNMSESRFSHIFKEESGVSYVEFVNLYRMKVATLLLRDTDLLVNEIANQVGIDNPNYFSAQYKKRTGKSPNEFRKSLLETK